MNLRTLIPAAALTLAATLIPAPANAAIFGGDIYHANDKGYAAPFHLYCEDDGWFLLNERQDSDDRCESEDVNKILVRRNEQIVCWQDYRGVGGWRIKWDAADVHEVADFFSSHCVAQRD